MPDKSLSQVPRELAERLVDLQEAGRIMHESWARTKRAQGFHGPNEPCSANWPHSNIVQCPKYHADLIPWDDLPQQQKDINLNAFKDVFAVLKPKAEAVIREAMHIALSHIIAELHEYADTDMPSDRLIGIDTAIERARATASSLAEQETTK